MIIRVVEFYGLLWFQLISGVRFRWISTKLDSLITRACMVLVKHKYLKQLMVAIMVIYLSGNR
jgi:hypothetical protein